MGDRGGVSHLQLGCQGERAPEGDALGLTLEGGLDLVGWGGWEAISHFRRGEDKGPEAGSPSMVRNRELTQRKTSEFVGSCGGPWTVSWGRGPESHKPRSPWRKSVVSGQHGSEGK